MLRITVRTPLFSDHCTAKPELKYEEAVKPITKLKSNRKTITCIKCNYCEIIKRTWSKCKGKGNRNRKNNPDMSNLWLRFLQLKAKPIHENKIKINVIIEFRLKEDIYVNYLIFFRLKVLSERKGRHKRQGGLDILQ